ncbi:MAG: hypothetical protein GEU78_16495 [Actinobacteria bacterium]|nr:hypothetical protein [Actinomycetota bacterium]
MVRGKPACPVLRGLRRGNTPELPDERWFSALTTKKLQQSAHRTAKALAADIQDWIDTYNHDPKPLKWHKTAEGILDRLASYCHAITHGA